MADDGWTYHPPGSAAPSDGWTYEPPAKPSSLARRAIGDPLVSLVKGAIGVPEALVGIADIPTGGLAGRAAEGAGIRFKDARAVADTFYSPEQRATNQKIADTKGFLPTIATAVQNPSVIAHQAIESAPSMLAGGVIGRGARALAPGLAPVAAGGIGEGAISAGQTAEQVRQETPGGTLSPGQSAIAAGSGAITGVIGYGAGRAAQRIGLTDFDILAAGGDLAKPGPGLARRVAGGALAEGVLEEMPQSAQEQAAQNLALGRPLAEGVPEATAMGGLVGGLMGAGANVMTGKPPPAPPPVAPAAPPETIDQQFERAYGAAPGGLTDEQISAQRQAVAERELLNPTAPTPFNADEHFAGIVASPQESTQETLATVPGAQAQAAAVAPAAAPLAARRGPAEIADAVKRADIESAYALAQRAGDTRKQRELAALLADSRLPAQEYNAAVAQAMAPATPPLNAMQLAMQRARAKREADARAIEVAGNGGPLSRTAASAVRSGVTDGIQQQQAAAAGAAQQQAVDAAQQQEAAAAQAEQQKAVQQQLDAATKAADKAKATEEKAAQAAATAALAPRVEGKPAAPAPTKAEAKVHTGALQRSIDAVTQQAAALAPTDPEGAAALTRQADTLAKGQQALGETKPSPVETKVAPAETKPVATAPAARTGETIDRSTGESSSAAPISTPSAAKATPGAPIVPRTEGAAATPAVIGETATAGKPGETPPDVSRPGAAAPIPSHPTDAAAHEAATSPLNDKPEPTTPQIKAGNYPLGHIKVGPLDISIENPEGSTRSDKQHTPPRWSNEIKRAHYGYIRRTLATDGDHVDAFVKPGTAEDHAGPVFVIDQQKRDGTHDEPKVMIGYKSKLDAVGAYKANYPKGFKVGPVHETTMDEFNAWARSGDTKRPFGERTQAAPATPEEKPLPPGAAKMRAAKAARDAEKSPQKHLGQQNNAALKRLFKTAGIDIRERSDILGERAGAAHRGGHMPGTFRKTGTTLDHWGEKLVAEGWLEPESQSEVGNENVRASMQDVRDFMRRVFDGEPVWKRDQMEERAVWAEEQSGRMDGDLTPLELLDLADSSLSPAENIEAFDAAKFLRESGLSESEQEAILERAAIQSDDQSFEQAVRDAAAEASRRGASGAREAAREEAARPGLDLAGQTNAEVLAAEAAQRKAADAAAADEETARKEAERAAIRDRSAAAAGTFELGQSAERNLAATDDLFAAPEAKPAKAEAKPETANTEDSGAELAYNRRNRIRTGIQWSDIADKNPTLQVKETTKQNVYPRPDYEALAKTVQHPTVAHIVKQVYDSIAAKPQVRGAPTAEDLQRYIAGVHRVMDGVMAWANDQNQTAAFFGSIGQRAQTLLGASRGQPTSLAALSARTGKPLVDAVYPNGWREHVDELRAIGGNKVMGALQPSTDEVIKGLKAIEEGWPASVEAWQKRFVIEEKDGAFRIMLKAAKWRLAKGSAAEGYPSRDVAAEAARALTKREGKDAISDKGISVEAATREGPARRMEGEDVSSDQLKEAFGFKGVNFGNWMKGDANRAERQLHLNHAYDAFHDLAELLDVPPRAVSLNGMLGVAIGAQGSGSYAAHFVPGVNEINLTRTSGAGSLAHEWGHALDHYFAAQAGMATRADPFLTEHLGLKIPDGIRPEIASAFRSIVQAMNRKQETPDQLVGRLEASKRDAASRIDRWLAAIKREFIAAKVDEAKFDAIAAKIKALDLGDGHMQVGNTALSPRVDELRQLYKATRGRVYPLDNIKGLQSNVDHAVYLTSERAAENAHTPQMVGTDYAAAAAALDQQKGGKRYWSTNLEKFARAFDAYVSDKLEAKAQKNTYLSHAGRTGETVPQGAERTAINTAFDTLVGGIETKPTDKGVAMFSESAPNPKLKEGTWRHLAFDAPLSAQDVRAMVRDYTFHLKNVPRINIAPIAQWPFASRSQKIRNASESKRTVRGAYAAGEVWLDPNALKDEAAVKFVLQHELGHYGMAGILKDRLKPTMQAIFDTNPDIANAAMDKMARLGYGPARATEEILADRLGNGDFHTITGWQRLFAVVRQALRAMGIRIKFSNADVAALLSDAWRFVEEPNAKPARTDDGAKLSEEATAGSSNRASWDAPEPSRLDDIVHTLQDKHIDLRRVQQAITKHAAIADESDPYLREELYHGRAAKATEDFVNNELKPLIGVMSLRKVSAADLEKFLHARHAEERNIQIAKVNPEMPDGGSGMTTADAKAYLAGLTPAQRTTFDALAKRVDAITAGTRQTLVDYGLESPKTIEAWKAAYQNYVPLYREDGGGGPGNGQGFSVKGSASKRATGSTKGVENILANIAMQRERAITRGEKNRVATALIGLAESNPNPDFWKVDQPPKIQYIDPSTGLVASTIDPLAKSRDNIVVARVPGADGEVQERMVVFNESDERAVRMARSLKNLDAEQLGEFLGAAAKGTRFLAAMSTVYNPLFGPVNLTRDVQQSMFNLSSTRLRGKQSEVLKNVLPALKGIYLDLRAARAGKEPTTEYGKLWDEFQKVGGQTGYRDLFLNSADRAKAIEREISASPGSARQIMKVVAEWLSDYNSALENAVRLSAYKVGKESGMTQERSASLAKNLTVNFNRKGAVTTQLNSLYAFVNANVQGSARLLETLRGPMGLKIIAGGVALGALQALALAGADFDDDDPPQFVRERNTVIPIGDKQYLTIPMPLGLHFIPNIGRIATEFALSGFKHPGDRLVSLMNVFADAFNPIGSAGVSMQTITPTLLDPAAALAENKDWTGKPIARLDFNPLAPTPGYKRAKDSSSVVSQAISKAMNYATGGTAYTPGIFSPTPDQIDYLLGQVTGGVGRETLRVFQASNSVLTGEDLPTYKMPLIGRFYGETGQPSSVAGSFYDNLRMINMHEAEIKGRRKANEPIGDYFKENPEARLFMLANATERRVSQLRKVRRELLDKEAEPDRVRAQDALITAAMERFNARVKQVSAAAP